MLFSEKEWSDILNPVKASDINHDEILEKKKAEEERRNRLKVISIINQNKVDSDSAYKRIRILKRTLHELDKDINATNVQCMPEDLVILYGEIKIKIKQIISMESSLVESGEQYYE